MSVEETTSTLQSVQLAACTNYRGNSIPSYMLGCHPTLNRASPLETLVVDRDYLDDHTPYNEDEVRVREENAVEHSAPSSSRWTKSKPNSKLSKEVKLFTMFLSLLHIVKQ